MNKKNQKPIFTPKFKSIGNIWTVLAGPCKKKVRTNQNYDFIAQTELMIFKIFRRWSCLPNFERRRFPYKSKFFHYFSKAIYECLRLNRGTPSKSRVLSSFPRQSISKEFSSKLFVGYLLPSTVTVVSFIISIKQILHWTKSFNMNNVHSQISQPPPSKQKIITRPQSHKTRDMFKKLKYHQ